MQERQLLLSLLFKKNPSIMPLGVFLVIHPFVMNCKKLKKVRTFLVRMLSCLWPNRDNNFLFVCFGKVYASVEDLAVRRM